MLSFCLLFFTLAACILPTHCEHMPHAFPPHDIIDNRRLLPNATRAAMSRLSTTGLLTL